MRVSVAIAPRYDKFLAAHGRGRIFEDHFERVRNLSVVVDDIFSAEGADGLWRAPIGKRSSRIVPKGAKRADAAIAVVGVIRSGAEPKVPVQPRGRIAVRRMAHA